MDWRAKVELFEVIRRENRNGMSIRAIAREHGIHRRMVREAIRSALPAKRKKPVRKSPKLDGLKFFIDGILKADQTAPRKQRHTALRIWERVRDEKSADIGLSTIRKYVRKRRAELGLENKEKFVPQTYLPGSEGQFDWYEARAYIGGEIVNLQVCVLRSMYSADAFHQAFIRSTQQAMLEFHENAFEYFGGIFEIIRYDNLKSAVKKILRGYQRDESARFIAFRSHWGYEAQFCNPARGNEKGGAENEVGRGRRKYLVPVPEFENLAELNQYLAQCCRNDADRRLPERTETVGEMMEQEREKLLPLAEEGFELTEIYSPKVDGKGCVKVLRNWYSTPLPVGVRPIARAHADRIEILYENRTAAVHERCYGIGKKIFELEHYLDVLEKKPGALTGATPLAQRRAQGRWPAAFDEIWRIFIERKGRLDGNRTMVDLLKLGKEYGDDELKSAVEWALENGCSDPAAVRHLVMSRDLNREAETEVFEWREHEHFERSEPVIDHYDLLTEGVR